MKHQSILSVLVGLALSSIASLGVAVFADEPAPALAPTVTLSPVEATATVDPVESVSPVLMNPTKAGTNLVYHDLDVRTSGLRGVATAPGDSFTFQGKNSITTGTLTLADFADDGSIVNAKDGQLHIVEDAMAKILTKGAIDNKGQIDIKGMPTVGPNGSITLTKLQASGSEPVFMPNDGNVRFIGVKGITNDSDALLSIEAPIVQVQAGQGEAGIVNKGTIDLRSYTLYTDAAKTKIQGFSTEDYKDWIKTPAEWRYSGHVLVAADVDNAGTLAIRSGDVAIVSDTFTNEPNGVVTIKSSGLYTQSLSDGVAGDITNKGHMSFTGHVIQFGNNVENDGVLSFNRLTKGQRINPVFGFAYTGTGKIEVGGDLTEVSDLSAPDPSKAPKLNNVDTLNFQGAVSGSTEIVARDPLSTAVLTSKANPDVIESNNGGGDIPATAFYGIAATDGPALATLQARDAKHFHWVLDEKSLNPEYALAASVAGTVLDADSLLTNKVFQGRHAHDLWGQALYAHNTRKSPADVESKANHWGLQIGKDIVSKVDGQKKTVSGIMAGYVHTNADLTNAHGLNYADGKYVHAVQDLGTVKTDSYGLGFYHTREGAGEHQDFTAQLLFNNTKLPDGVKANSRGFALSYAYGKDLVSHGDWALEGRTQWNYTHLSNDDYSVAGAAVIPEASNDLQGSLGLRYYKPGAEQTPYVSLDFVRAFTAEPSVLLSGVSYGEDYGRSRVQLGFGGNFNLQKATSLFGDVKYSHSLGSGKTESVAVNLGVQHKF